MQVVAREEPNQGGGSNVLDLIKIKKQNTKNFTNKHDRSVIVPISSTTYQQHIRFQALEYINLAEFSAACAHPQHNAARQYHLGSSSTPAGGNEFSVTFAGYARQYQGKSATSTLQRRNSYRNIQN